MIGITPELVVYYVAAGGCVGLVAWAIFLSVRPLPQAMREAQPEHSGTRSPIFQLLAPPAHWMGLVVADMCARIELKIGRDARRSILLSSRIRAGKSLMAAGRPEGLNADDFLGLIILSAFAGLIAGLALYKFIGSPFLVVLCAVVFAYLPVRWLRSKVQQRHNEINY